MNGERVIRLVYPDSLEDRVDFVALAESLGTEPQRYVGGPWAAVGGRKPSVEAVIVVDAASTRFPRDMTALVEAGHTGLLVAARHPDAATVAMAAEGKLGVTTDDCASMIAAIASAVGVCRRAVACEAERDELVRTRSVLHAAMEASPVGILVAGASSPFIRFANGSAARILGTARERLLSIPKDGLNRLPWKFYGEAGDSRDSADLPLWRALENGESSIDERHRLVREDGSELFLSTNAAPVHGADGEVEGAVVLFDDVSDIVLARKDLARSEARYRELFEAESDAIFLIENATGRLLEANEAACAMYGYSRDELLAMRNEDLSAEAEETRHVTTTTPVIKGNVVLVPLRWHRKRDGASFPVEITGRFFELEGRPVHIAAIRDITGRVEDERKLKRAADEKNSLLKELKHRAKNTLALIASLVDLEIDGSGEDERLVRLRDRIASFAALYGLLQNSGDAETVALDSYCERVLDLIRDSYALEERGIALSFSGAAASLSLKSAEAFGLVLSETVTNAVKHAFPGGKTGKVSVELLARGDRIRLVVRDDGEGIDARVRGPGAGLAIADMLARQLEGRIETTDSGAGTVVILEIPAETGK